MQEQSNHPNYSPAVANLQRYLRQLASASPEIGQVPVDGIFDTDTRKALQNYQRMADLPVTGVADRLTWESLYADYLVSLERYAPPTPISIYPRNPVGGFLDVGAVGIDVAVLQYMLGELTLLFPITPPAVTGTYDVATANAVRDMQELLGLTPNGLVDILTWNAIADRFNALPAGSEAQ